jgi:hypothetical protein
LKSQFNFEQALIEKVACRDEVARAILQQLFEAGSAGLLPKDLAMRLAEFKVTRHQVRRRIVGMNKRLRKELGFAVAGQRGWHWALTSFSLDAWGETQNSEKVLFENP